MNTNNTSENPKQALELVVSKRREIKSQNIMRCIQFIQDDISFEKTWKTALLAEVLDMKPDTVAFGIAMSEVNRALERNGYHLTTRGKHGQEYFIEPVKRAAAVGDTMMRDAMNSMKRAVVYLNGVATKHAELLTETERRRIEKRAEIGALRYVLCSRIR